jgi:hypothetical protein
MKQKNSKQKYKPLSAATPEEKREAFRLAGLWTTTRVEGRTEVGAFSEANLGIPAVEYFPLRAYQILNEPDCKWKWKEGSKLSTLMINVIRSEMAHVLRDHMLDGAPIVKANSEFEREDADEDGFDDANDPVDVDPADRQNGFQVKSDMELLEELQQREKRRDKGYKIAKAAAKGDAVLEKYVEVVFGGASTDREVSKKMKKTLAELQELQERLIARIRENI